ncbi:MAG: PAS domain S-box protein [Ekhidna sp.]
MEQTTELLSVLYELSLTNLEYKNPEDTAEGFVKKFISRRSLQAGSVWAISDKGTGQLKLTKIYATPESEVEVYVDKTTFGKENFILSSESLIPSRKMKGQYAYFKLGEFGVLELFHNGATPINFTKESFTPFLDVVSQFAVSLESGFFNLKLKQEVRNRIAAEESLEKNQKKYRRIIDNIQLGLMEVDNDEIIQFANKPFLDLTGYELEEIVGRKASEVLIDQDDHEMLAEVARQTENRKSGDSASYEIVIKDKQGNKKWAIISGAPNYDDQGNLIGSIGIHLDITEEKKLKQENEFREIQLKKLFEKSLDALITIDSKGLIKEWSPQAEAIFGYTEAEIIGERLSEKIVPHAHREGHEKGMDHYHNTGHGPVLNTRIEIIGLRKSGEIFPIELTVFPVEHQNETFFTAFVRDITELKKSKEDVEKALKRQTELNNLKSQFISMTSHELRTPLTTIRSNTELLNYQLDNFDRLDKSKLKKNVSRIETNVERLNQLVTNILMIGQLDSQKVPFDPESTDIFEFIQEAVLPDFISRRQPISCSKEGIPFKVKIDKRLFGHIMNNLIENALKYSEGSEKKPELFLDFYDDHLALHVKDHGMGIPEEEQEKLFDTFFRASNVGNIQGTGLGLSIVNEFVKIHGGDIKVDSAVGKGTTFIITFPK